jgi:hypothetical protein
MCPLSILLRLPDSFGMIARHFCVLLSESYFVALKEQSSALLSHFYGTVNHAIINHMKYNMSFLDRKPFSLPYRAHSACRATIERYLLAAG